MKTKQILLFSALSMVLMSFISGKKPSEKTAKKQLDEFCAYVPSGTTLNQKDTVSVQGFYMSKGEITNFQYQEFLHDLKRRGELDKLKIAQIDTNNWTTELKWGNQAYSEHYHDHPAYRNYPVVNISAEGAELYCKWLTEKYDSLSGGEMKLKFRIPTHIEWLRAVRGNHTVCSYAWGGPYLQNSQGAFLANFIRSGGECITRNQQTGKLEVTTENIGYVFDTKNADVTAPSISYWPNDFGFYNMNGNVSEMISDKDVVVGGDWRSPGYDIRNESTRAYKGSSVTVGFRVIATYVEN
jgi:formylglycine-generating enzyme required for sulfatase activity